MWSEGAEGFWEKDPVARSCLDVVGSGEDLGPTSHLTTVTVGV